MFVSLIIYQSRGNCSTKVHPSYPAIDKRESPLLISCEKGQGIPIRGYTILALVSVQKLKIYDPHENNNNHRRPCSMIRQCCELKPDRPLQKRTIIVKKFKTSHRIRTACWSGLSGRPWSLNAGTQLLSHFSFSF